MTAKKRRYKSGMTRPLYVTYPTNFFILVLSVFAGFIGLAVALISGDGMVEGIWSGVHVAMAIFIAWVLRRELDPDHDYSAFVAAGIALVAALVLDARINFVALVVLIYTARVVNRSSGLAITRHDAILLVILAAWVGAGSFWLLGLILSFALVLDGTFPNGYEYARITAGIVCLTTLVSAGLHESFAWNAALSASDVVIVVLVLLLTRFFIPGIPAEMNSTGDYSRSLLDRRRVIYAGTLLALAAILVSWSGDDNTVIGILPLPASFSGVVLYHFWLKLNPGEQPVSTVEPTSKAPR